MENREYFSDNSSNFEYNLLVSIPYSEDSAALEADGVVVCLLEAETEELAHFALFEEEEAASLDPSEEGEAT